MCSHSESLEGKEAAGLLKGGKNPHFNVPKFTSLGICMNVSVEIISILAPISLPLSDQE